MSFPSEIDAEQVRTLASDIVERLNVDPAFGDQLKEDPVSTLSSVGMPELAIPIFLREISPSEDVSGFMHQSGGQFCTVIFTSCLVTSPNKTFVSR